MATDTGAVGSCRPVCKGLDEYFIDKLVDLNRDRKRLSPSPPSEPVVRFSRDGLSSQLFPHRDWRAN